MTIQDSVTQVQMEAETETENPTRREAQVAVQENVGAAVTRITSCRAVQWTLGPV